MLVSLKYIFNFWLVKSLPLSQNWCVKLCPIIVLGDEMFLPLDYIGQEQLFLYLKMTTTHCVLYL